MISRETVFTSDATLFTTASCAQAQPAEAKLSATAKTWRDVARFIRGIVADSGAGTKRICLARRNIVQRAMKKAIDHLAKSDPRFADLISRSRKFDVIANKLVRPFEALAESIAYQQLSGKAAATIWGRVRALYPRRKNLDAKLVLETPDETLRAAGLSRSKVAALKDLAAKTLDGTVPSRRALAKMSDDEIIERLITVRGIGRWTAEMLLLFDLARPDVWPGHDYRVRKD